MALVRPWVMTVLVICLSKISHSQIDNQGKQCIVITWHVSTTYYANTEQPWGGSTIGKEITPILQGGRGGRGRGYHRFVLVTTFQFHNLIFSIKCVLLTGYLHSLFLVVEQLYTHPTQYLCLFFCRPYVNFLVLIFISFKVK